jgi:hypothetical protein
VNHEGLEIVAAVGQIEALVAEREIRDLLVAHRDREPGQLWNDASTTLYLSKRPSPRVLAT